MYTFETLKEIDIYIKIDKKNSLTLKIIKIIRRKDRSQAHKEFLLTHYGLLLKESIK